jgi:hypothetical protein
MAVKAVYSQTETFIKMQYPLGRVLPPLVLSSTLHCLFFFFSERYLFVP